MLNVAILSCLLILAGGLGVSDSAEGQFPGSNSNSVVNNYHNNAGMPPTVQIIEGVGTNTDEGYHTSFYYAMVDVDGNITSAGFDVDLDGTIDVSVSESKGIVSLTIPISEWFEVDRAGYEAEMITTVAFIAIDDDSLYTVEMYTLYTDEFEEEEEDCGNGMYILEAADHSDPVVDDAGLLTLVWNGNNCDLEWGDFQIEILQNGEATTCAVPFDTEFANCTVEQFGGQDDEIWEKGETVVISDTGANFCDAADCHLAITVGSWSDVPPPGQYVIFMSATVILM